MNTQTLSHPVRHEVNHLIDDPKLAKKPEAIAYEDPLDADAEDDAVLMTTRRQLIRLALIAAETGARFERDGVAFDAMMWMLAPRKLFGGRAAMEACLDRQECVRALVLHGLSIGLDADPCEIDGLAEEEPEDEGMFDADFDDEDGEVVEEERPFDVDFHDDELDLPVPANGEGGDGLRPWTSLVVDEGSGAMMRVFDAVIAGSRAEAEMRLRVRHGRESAEAMEVVEGFDAGVPLVEALVLPAVDDMPSLVAGGPGSPLARGLSASVEQRSAA